MDNFERKAKFIAFLDQARWSNGENYYGINYSHKENPLDKELSSDQKILTHWLCYISDRQMDFMQIWDVGGFVYSDLVYEYSNGGKSVKDLLNPDNDKSFFVNNPDGGNNLKDETGNPIHDENGNPKKEKAYMFLSNEEPNDIIKKRYTRFIYKDIDNKEEKVKFTPRYYPSDYVSIYYTLSILEKFDKSFSSYLNTLIKKAIEYYEKNKKANEEELNKCQIIIQYLFAGLYLLSYCDIGSPTKHNIENYVTNTDDSKNDLKSLKITRNAEKRAELISGWLTDNEDTTEFYEKVKIIYNGKKNNKEIRYSSKRIWCCIRDYLKHKRDDKEGFNDLFINALGITEPTFNNEMLNLLELPGDLWNNNSTFRKCLLLEESSSKNQSLNKILRDKYDDIKKESPNKTFYPEQFDVTFNFVPRMCEQGKCEYCPMCPEHGGSKEKLKKLCSRNKGLFCPAVLMYTGYFYECKEQEKCYLKKLINP